MSNNEETSKVTEVTEVTESMNSNIADIEGEITEKPIFSHEVFGEKFFETKVKILRLSGYEDVIRLIVSERLVNIDDINIGSKVIISGNLRSHNSEVNNKNKLIISIFAKSLEIAEDEDVHNINSVTLKGFICKPPIYRTTSLGREISDLLIAVNRSYGKSDYIPCIAWGRNAKYSSDLKVGDLITIEGRIQSREYNKTVDEGIIEKHTAYEMSISKISKEDN